jgi:Secretory lipase
MRRPSLVLCTALLVAATVAGCTGSDDSDPTAMTSEVPGAGPTVTVADPVEGAPCAGRGGVGGIAPAGAAPGDLVDAVEVADPDPGRSDYPSNATVWRVLYVSTGLDETDLQLVCGLVAAPTGGPAVDGAGTGHLLSWAHGTIGLQQACLPSNHPESTFWAPMGSGIGAIGWGSGLGAHLGSAVDGALQVAMNRGWVVAATDYQPNDTYIMGRVAGANVIDIGRAAAQLMTRQFATPDTTTYDSIMWGHSQGGHAALWAGQLLESYVAATSPAGAPPVLRLRGVAAEAPAVNLIAEPDQQPSVAYGDGVADWEMHTSIELIGLPIPSLEIQIGPALFSYIFGSWSEFSAQGAPAEGAAFPAFPATAANLDLDAVATTEGRTTIAQVLPLCLSQADATTVKKIVAPYRDASKHQMLTSELWNLPEQDYRPGRFFKGGVDRTCATADDDDAMTPWCEWIRWNTPGPLGVHPFPTVPTVEGRPVPVLLAQGNDDTVIHCVTPKDGDATRPPESADCMSSALYEVMRDRAYCPASGAAGHLRQIVFRKDGSASPGSHLSIPGQVAAKGASKSAADLSFAGSPLDEFMTGAFGGTLAPGCEAAVRNP